MTIKTEVIDDQTMAEIERLPQCSLEELRTRAYAFEVGERILKEEFGIEIIEDEE